MGVYAGGGMVMVREVEVGAEVWLDVEAEVEV